MKPLDTETILRDIFNFQTIITVEDGCIQGGFGQSVASVLMQHSYRGKVIHLGIPDAFAAHGDNHILYESCGYSEGKIATLIQQIAGKSGE